MLRRAALAGCISGDETEVFTGEELRYLNKKNHRDCIEIESQNLCLHSGIQNSV